MKMIKEFEGIMPEIDESVFVAESADIIGDVKIGKNSSVWYNTVLRGDEHAIRIGKNTNIQDGTVVHVGLDVDTVIGDNVTVGHNALVHGCKIGNNSLVGMGAIVLNGAEIGEFCMIGAGALVTQNKKFPDGMLIIGSPAKAVRELTEEEKQSLVKSADDYCANAQKHK
jgi:carbonic anhydrase/acetyltransferase-like protein (isoleucine patch superfamily)